MPNHDKLEEATSSSCDGATSNLIVPSFDSFITQLMAIPDKLIFVASIPAPKVTVQTDEEDGIEQTVSHESKEFELDVTEPTDFEDDSHVKQRSLDLDTEGSQLSYLSQSESRVPIGRARSNSAPSKSPTLHRFEDSNTDGDVANMYFNDASAADALTPFESNDFYTLSQQKSLRNLSGIATEHFECRPSIVVDHAVHTDNIEFHSNDSPSVDEASDQKEVIEPNTLQKKHLSWFAHGKFLTIISLVTAISALILAILSKRSLEFAVLADPLYVSPYFQKVEKIGIYRMRLCFNESVSEGGTTTSMGEYNLSTVTTSTTSSAGVSKSSSSPGPGCYAQDLTTENVNDVMWNVSRCFLSSAIYLGAFLTAMLLSSIYWESINMKPIALGFLVAYFFQSFSFFFFDSMLCRTNACRLSGGSIVSIFSCFFWFVSGLVCLRMDTVYHAKLRLAERLHQRRARKAKQQALSAMESTLGTVIVTPFSTPPSSPRSRSGRVLVMDEEQGVIPDGDLYLAPA